MISLPCWSTGHDLYKVMSLSRWRKEWGGVILEWVRRVARMQTSWQLDGSSLRHCMDNPPPWYLHDPGSMQHVYPPTRETTAHHVTATDSHKSTFTYDELTYRCCFWRYHTIAYLTSVFLRMKNITNTLVYADIRLVYVRHTLYTFQARCDTLAYAGIRWGRKLLLGMLCRVSVYKKLCNYVA